MKRALSLALIGISLMVVSPALAPLHATDLSVEEAQSGKHITVSGKVIDEDKEPLTGVTIRVKGAPNKGAVTDINGVYSISEVPADGTLVVSFIGMETQEIAVKGRTTINITLKESSTTLGEVTVTTGYQEVKRERMTGAVATIDASQIRNLNVKSVDQILAGNIAGLSSVTTGRPGATASIHIRGVNSLTGNTDPIWIVDGMPLQGEKPSLMRSGGELNAELFQNGIGDISPDDIESITVLKDAAASAIYGARAANGVIVIKTKSGSAGKTTYNVTANFGISSRPERTVPMMNSEEKIQFEREMYADESFAYVGRASYLLDQVATGLMTEEQAEAEIARLKTINTNWFKELYRPAFSTQVSLSRSGGTEKTSHYTSANYLDQQGTELNNHLRRLRFSSKLSHSFSSRVKLDTQLSATYRDDKRSSAAFNTFRYALYANPYEDPEGYDLSWNMTRSRIHPGFRWTTLNAKREMEENYFTTRYLSASLLLRLDWKILDNLTFSSQGMVTGNSTHNRTVEGPGTYTNFQNNWLWSIVKDEIRPEQVQGSLDEGTSYSADYTWRNTLSYNLEYEDTHFLDLLLGQEITSDLTYTSYNYSPIFDQVHRIVGFPELSEGIDVKKINFQGLGGTGRYESKLSSFFLNATYSYRDRYVLSSSVRYDGSDIIGNNNQFVPLWNTSFRWNVSKEPFFKSDFFDLLSLRLGYGYTGSIDKNAFPFVIMRIDKRYEFDGQIIPNGFTHANPNVRWQTKRDFNIGVETSMWKGRIRAGINYYNNFVFDLLDNRRLP